MPEHIQYEDDDLFNPETHHESSDVPVRPLFWFIIIFVIFAVVSHFALWFLYKAFVKGEQTRAKRDGVQTLVARPADADVPQNQPLLQPFPRGEVPPQRSTPVTDLEDMRAAEERQLENYGWVDKQRGIVHIPIEKAKELALLQLTRQPVAAPAPPAAPASNTSPAGTTVPPDTGAVPPATTTSGGHQ